MFDRTFRYYYFYFLLFLFLIVRNRSKKSTSSSALNLRLRSNVGWTIQDGCAQCDLKHELFSLCLDRFGGLYGHFNHSYYCNTLLRPYLCLWPIAYLFWSAWYSANATATTASTERNNKLEVWAWHQIRVGSQRTSNVSDMLIANHVTVSSLVAPSHCLVFTETACCGMWKMSTATSEEIVDKNGNVSSPVWQFFWILQVRLMLSVNYARP